MRPVKKFLHYDIDYQCDEVCWDQSSDTDYWKVHHELASRIDGRIWFHVRFEVLDKVQ